MLDTAFKPQDLFFDKDDKGLGDQTADTWKGYAGSEQPIDRLKPDSELHKKVLDYLLARLTDSEREMSRFYARWSMIEKKMQAYIDLPDWERRLKEMNDSGKPPSAISVVIPHMFSVINTIVTYLVHTFTGRKPIFQVGSYDADAADRARMQEIKLQYDSDHTRMIRMLVQFYYDSQAYGFGALGVEWQNEVGMRTIRGQVPMYDVYGNVLGMTDTSRREERTVYEGNCVHNIDPYMFFPDPRVPLQHVNARGEYVFWRKYEGRHMLLRQEASGNMKYVKSAKNQLPRQDYHSQSSRGLISGGHGTAGQDYRMAQKSTPFMQVDMGSIEIIPKELGLGDSEKPEKWIFGILNKNQIVLAKPQTNDHGRHPVVVTEPYTQGYGFGNPGMGDYAGPFQDMQGFLVNSHMDNVRKVLNDMLIVDPSMIEMQDLKSPEPGKLIRLKRAAYGQDVRTAVNQLQVVDVTKGNIQDLELFSMFSQRMSGVSENRMGVQDSGGRKTATEVRTSGEAGISRLAAQAVIISAQGMCDLTEMMSINNMQYLSSPFFVSVVGKDGLKKGLWIQPEMLIGDFYYPVNDGTLPVDRIAMLDVWKEIMIAVLQDQGLRQAYDVPKLFEYVAGLGGAKNIENMRVKTAGPGAIDSGVQSGNLAPMAGMAPTKGIDASPGDRAAQSMFPS